MEHSFSLNALDSWHSAVTQFEGRMIYSDSLSTGTGGYALCIHGGGASGSTTYQGLRQFLLNHGVGSTALDCIGHGRTGGRFEDSSLASREQQILTVAQQQAIAPTILVGASMGAYNAILLAKQLGVHHLVLVVPGIYVPDAFHIPFGPEFTATIRRERSWEDSDAWNAISEFTGRLLVVAAELDEVIPAEIPQKLISSATRAEFSQLVTVPEAKHSGLLPKLLNSVDGVAALQSCLQLGNPVM
ncbi:alpha/beta fold hydrolase [Diaphorobacter caeni]|uniref:alpha/beta fold hydrolase n=1 Tax=Diaphorobacter caeni TaxID=2784387 RepID=UPI00188EB5C7|nr:alpha/beta hydrolase [Diaphorobacter caeni]MBF5005817.1 alpha/beta hydrolase [Diaphorobacter caeni]